MSFVYDKKFTPILSSMTTSAPASIASFASTSFWTSTSILNEKPETDLAASMAFVIDPIMTMLTEWNFLTF